MVPKIVAVDADESQTSVKLMVHIDDSISVNRTFSFVFWYRFSSQIAIRFTKYFVLPQSIDIPDQISFDYIVSTLSCPYPVYPVNSQPALLASYILFHYWYCTQCRN